MRLQESQLPKRFTMNHLKPLNTKRFAFHKEMKEFIQKTRAHGAHRCRVDAGLSPSDWGRSLLLRQQSVRGPEARVKHLCGDENRGSPQQRAWPTCPGRQAAPLGPSELCSVLELPAWPKLPSRTPGCAHAWACFPALYKYASAQKDGEGALF